MSPLSRSQLAELHRALQEQQKALRQQLDDSREGARPVRIDAPIGRLSRMDAMQQQRMVQANRLTAQSRLARIEAALRRFHHDQYGLCLECEEEIGTPRLTAQPDAAFCIRCQKSREGRND